jgi:hypothetical protein
LFEYIWSRRGDQPPASSTSDPRTFPMTPFYEEEDEINQPQDPSGAQFPFEDRKNPSFNTNSPVGDRRLGQQIPEQPQQFLQQPQQPARQYPQQIQEQPQQPAQQHPQQIQEQPQQPAQQYPPQNQEQPQQLQTVQQQQQPSYHHPTQEQDPVADSLVTDSKGLGEKLMVSLGLADV